MTKRVAIVLYFYQCNGGAHRYLHAVCEAWHKRGYEFEVWYYRSESDEPAPPYACKLPGVYPVRFFYINRVLQLAAAVAAEIARRKRARGKSGPIPDTFVVIDAGEAWLLGMVASVFGLRLIHNDRGMDSYFRAVLNTVDYYFIRLAQKLGRPFVHTWVVNSGTKAEELIKAGIPAARIRIVPNGLRLHLPADMPVLADGGHEEAPSLLLGYFSRPSYDRGIDIVFGLIRLLARSGNTDGLLFFMTVDEQHIPADLRDLEWIIPLGTVSHEDVASWMARTDIILVPTRHESFGNTVLEGLYYGAGVLASDVGSLREWRTMEGVVLVEDYENPGAWLEILASAVAQLRTGQPRRFREELAAQYNLEQQADALYRVFSGAEDI